MAGGLIQLSRNGWCLCALAAVLAITPLSSVDGVERGGSLFKRPLNNPLSSYAQRQDVISRLPLQRLTPKAQQRILAIAKSPTLYRRLPTQAIDCDREMFLFLTRNPEVMIGIWDLMGITAVQTRRTGPYQFEAEDGSGTDCLVDLVYGDPHVHIYVAEGSYDGAMVAKPIRGKGVFVVRSSYATGSDGGTTVTGTIDCFVQIESLGADLVARTLSGLIGRSADNNFVETARFMAQVSQASAKNPPAMIDVAARLPQVEETTRREFLAVINGIAEKSDDRLRTAGNPTQRRSRSTPRTINPRR